MPITVTTVSSSISVMPRWRWAPRATWRVAQARMSMDMLELPRPQAMWC